VWLKPSMYWSGTSISNQGREISSMSSSASKESTMYCTVAESHGKNAITYFENVHIVNMTCPCIQEERTYNKGILHIAFGNFIPWDFIYRSIY